MKNSLYLSLWKNVEAARQIDQHRCNLQCDYNVNDHHNQLKGFAEDPSQKLKINLMNFNCKMSVICKKLRVVVINLGIFKYHFAHTQWHTYKQTYIYNGTYRRTAIFKHSPEVSEDTFEVPTKLA